MIWRCPSAIVRKPRRCAIVFKNGLNWYELLPILDDLATLMLAITDSGQHEFEAYLQQLNERLESFQSNLQAASDGHADNRSAAREMDTQIREQVDGLQSSMQEAADLDDLKHVLEKPSRRPARHHGPTPEAAR